MPARAALAFTGDTTPAARVVRSTGVKVAGLFSGVGGFELGLERAGHDSILLCDHDPAAQAVLKARFFGGRSSRRLRGDVNTLTNLPQSTDVVVAGFPCQDLSQVGTTSGIHGHKSGVVARVFDLLERRRVPWVLLENVPHMLYLQRGRAMAYLVERFERLGYSWAYRCVDTRAFGLPQRRRRVFFLASLDENPARVLFRGSHEPLWDDDVTRPGAPAYGFYWTEGNRGVGMARNAIPPLKGGSAHGIPSAPAVWFPRRSPGRAFVTPTIEAAEELQGFPRGWTGDDTDDYEHRRARWRLVGNAVSVPVAEWLGRSLLAPDPRGERAINGRFHPSSAGWPEAAYGAKGECHVANVTASPVQNRQVHTLRAILTNSSAPLSSRAALGFVTRLDHSNLTCVPGSFREALYAHLEARATP